MDALLTYCQEVFNVNRFFFEVGGAYIQKGLQRDNKQKKAGFVFETEPHVQIKQFEAKKIKTESRSKNSEHVFYV